MKKILKAFTNPYIGPIIAVSAIVGVILFYYLPQASQKNNQAQATENGLKLIESLRDVRSYYTAAVVPKVARQSDLKINFDHLEKEDTIPLPATLLHDLSAIVPKDGMMMRMYSEYPFPNRADRELDRFEERSLQWLTQNPDDVFAYVSEYGEEKAFRVAVSDKLVANACVQCHNSRADSPKTDWQLGDMRGVIEVIIPYNEDFILTPNQTLMLTFGLVFLLLAMGVHYSFLSFVRGKQHKQQEKQLQEKIEEKTASLQASNVLLNQYKKAVDESAIVSKTDKSGKITYVNDTFIKISGYSEDELIGKPHNIVRHPDMPKEAFKDLWQTIQKGQIWKGQITNRKKGGGEYHVASTIVPIIDANGEVAEYLGIRLDVTKIIEANQKALEADRAKSLFLANMSHEVRTPLNAIIGFSQVLSKSNALSIKDKKYASIIETSAKSLLGIINDILDISKIESGNFDVSMEATDICYVSEHVVELFSARAVEKNIKLIFDIDLMPACVVTDGVRLRQVLSNLLGNAIKFTPDNGKIFIDVKALEVDETKAKLHFSIKDTGIGIPHDKLATIFDAFTQVDNESNRKYEGTGLGLNICYNIVEALGGKLEVQSELDKGSEFYFSLECEICEGAMHESEHRVQNLKIAVTDNESQLYRYAKRFIHLFGEVKHISKQQSPDIVICCCGKEDANDIEKSRELFPNIAKLYLFEDQNIVENLKLTEDENAIALPFYASKINDSIAELILEKSKENSAVDEVKIDAKVLVAEDNSANQELIGYIFESMGLEYEIANNGQEAYEKYQKGGFDIVFMDINMPKVDGLEGLRLIREYESSQNIAQTPIIALTANAIKGDKERFLNAGMDDYLTKPIDTQSLQKMLQKYLKDNQTATKMVQTQEPIVEQNEQKAAIDSAAVAKKLGVSEKIAQMLVKKFESSIAKEMEEFGTIIASKQMQQIKEKAHYIKNSCLNMGLESACEILQTIETGSLSEDEVKEQFEKLQQLV